VITLVDCFQDSPLQASAVCALFGRIWDLENFDAVLHTLPRTVAAAVVTRLGCLNVVNPLRVAHFRYSLSLAWPDERRLIKVEHKIMY
jgi:hypothetical protein